MGTLNVQYISIVRPRSVFDRWLAYRKKGAVGIFDASDAKFFLFDETAYGELDVDDGNESLTGTVQMERRFGGSDLKAESALFFRKLQTYDFSASDDQTFLGELTLNLTDMEYDLEDTLPDAEVLLIYEIRFGPHDSAVVAIECTWD